MLLRPMAPSEANHSSVIGPNTRPTLAVPKRCVAKSATSTSSVTGTMKRCSCGAATSRPSIADSVVIAGVITPSPKNSDAPKIPRMPTAYAEREPLGNVRCASAMSAMMPPSPSLSARMMMVTYLSVTTIISAQKISDRMPSTVSWLATSP